MSQTQGYVIYIVQDSTYLNTYQYFYIQFYLSKTFTAMVDHF